MKRLLVFCTFTPFIVTLVSYIIMALLFEVLPEETWITEFYDNQKIEESKSTLKDYGMMFCACIPITFTIFLNLIKKVRHSFWASFFSFLWLDAICIISLIGTYFLSFSFLMFFAWFYLLFLMYRLPYLAFLILTFVYFRWKVSKGYFEKEEKIA